MEQIRCFVAIELPEEVKAALSRLQAKLKSGDRFPVKWVDPYGIHLTLNFGWEHGHLSFNFSSGT